MTKRLVEKRRRQRVASRVPLPRAVRVTVEPGDVIVLESPCAVTPEQRDGLTRKLRDLWPMNTSLILDNGVTLKIGTTVPALRRRVRAGWR